MEDSVCSQSDHSPPTCFVCLKLSPLPNPKLEEPISLRTIHRYLNIEPQQNGGKGGGEVVEDLVWWWLCEECAGVAGKLTDLCEQLELIQMKVDHSLELFYSKLLEGEEKERGKRRRSPSYESFQRVRAHTLQQCERSLRQARRLSIHLKKCSSFPPAANNNQHESHTNYATPCVPPTTIKTEQMMEVEEEEQETEQDFPCEPIISETKDPISQEEQIQSSNAPNLHRICTSTTPADSLLLQFLQRQPSPRVPHAQVVPCELAIHSMPSAPPPPISSFSPEEPLELVKCSSCPNNPVFSSKPEAARHQEEYHLEQLFPPSSYLHPRLPPSEYKAYCEHVVHTELLISNAKYTEGSTSFRYSCLHCATSLQVHFDSWRQLRTHLLSNHLNMLAAKLWELQRCTPPEELHQIRLPPLVDKKGDELQGTSAVASTSTSFAKKSVGVSRRSGSIRPSVISSTGLDLSGTGKCCPDCGAEFARRNLVKRHQTESCPFRRDKSKSSRKPTACPDCGVTFLHPGSFYHHRKEKHPHKAASKSSSTLFLNHFL